MTPAAEPRSFRLDLAICHLSGVLAGAGATMLGPILPVLARLWTLSDSASGALLASEFAGGFCGAIVSGWLASRLTPAKLLTAGLILLAAGFAGAALLLTPWMPPALFLCGLGLGFINPTANVIVARVSASPAAALNLFSFSWASGALATPAAIVFLLRYQPVNSVFLELAALAAAAAALSALPAMRPATSEPSPTPVGRRHAPSAFIVITGALLFLYVGIETSVSVWLPTVAARWAAMTASQAAAAQSAFWIALLIGRLLAPVWLRIVAPRALLFTGLVTAAAGVGLLLAAPGYAGIIAGAVFAGLGLAPVNPTIVAAFITRLGSAAARWTGPVFAAAGLGGAALPWLVGTISSQSGSMRLAFAAPLAAIAAMLCLQLKAASPVVDSLENGTLASLPPTPEAEPRTK